MKKIILALVSAAILMPMNAKTLVAYFSATSGSSGIEDAEAYLKKTYPSLNWQKGLLLNNH